MCRQLAGAGVRHRLTVTPGWKCLAMTMNPGIDQHVRELAAVQHGIIARRQLRELGAGDGAVRRRVESGYFTVESKRVLRLAGSPKTDASLLMAGVLDSGPGAAVAHGSCAAQWGLPGFDIRPVEVLGQRRRVSHGETELAIVHQPRHLLPSHVVELDHIPTTTPSRMLVDLAADPTMHPKRLERLLDTAWARALVCHESMTLVISEVCRRGRAGSTLLRELMAERPADYLPPGSSAEARFQEIARSMALTEFERQVDLGGDSRWIGRVDFVDRRRGVVVEVDSALYHGSLTDQRADEARHRLLAQAGFVVVSVDGNDLFHRRAKVENLLRPFRQLAA